jgi:hypothetical protein
MENVHKTDTSSRAYIGRHAKVGLRLIMCLLLVSCATVPTPPNGRPIHYDSRSFSDEDDHTYSIETNSQEPVDFKVRISNIAGDTDCEKGYIYGQDSVSINAPTERRFGFGRKGSPNIALYEWHMCFIKNAITYKAWRGFDPGANTALKVKCFIPTEQLVAQATDKYLCQTEKVIHSDDGYTEFAQYCWSKDTCRRFETEIDYNLFLKRGAANVALYKIVPSKEIRELKVDYEYIDEKQAEDFRLSLIAEGEKACLEEGDRSRRSCQVELSELNTLLLDSERWRYRLTENALIDSFPELKSLNVELQDTSAFDDVSTFKFTPHETKDSSVFFYTIDCPAEHRLAKNALCTISLNQAFYSESSSEYFYIEETSDIATAIWAYSGHKGVEITAVSEWIARWLQRPHRVPSIEIDGELAKFSYHSGGCWHQVWYRIIGNNEELEFFKATRGLCI